MYATARVDQVRNALLLKINNSWVHWIKAYNNVLLSTLNQVLSSSNGARKRTTKKQSRKVAMTPKKKRAHTPELSAYEQMVKRRREENEAAMVEIMGDVRRNSLHYCGIAYNVAVIIDMYSV